MASLILPCIFLFNSYTLSLSLHAQKQHARGGKIYISNVVLYYYYYYSLSGIELAHFALLRFHSLFKSSLFFYYLFIY